MSETDQPREILSLRHADAQIEARMLSGIEFTFGGLVDRYGRQHYRRIDKIIQRLRKAGKIAKRRDGRNFIWKATK